MSIPSNIHTCTGIRIRMYEFKYIYVSRACVVVMHLLQGARAVSLESFRALENKKCHCQDTF